MNLNEIIKELQKQQQEKSVTFNIEDKTLCLSGDVFIRTVTYHCTGHVEKIENGAVKLTTGAWIADSGRFMNAIKEGELDEVEPVGDMYVNIDSIVDWFPWKHPLPTEQK